MDCHAIWSQERDQHLHLNHVHSIQGAWRQIPEDICGRSQCAQRELGKAFVTFGCCLSQTQGNKFEVEPRKMLFCCQEYHFPGSCG